AYHWQRFKARQGASAWASPATPRTSDHLAANQCKTNGKWYPARVGEKVCSCSLLPGRAVPVTGCPLLGRDRSALCMGSPDVTWVTGQRFSTVGARYTLRNRRSFATLMCGSSSDLILY